MPRGFFKAMTKITSPNQNHTQFSSCYARLEAQELVVANAHVERRWRVENSLLVATSFRDLASGYEWLAQPADPLPPQSETPALRLEGSGGQAGPTEAPSLVATLTIASQARTTTYRFQIFPNAPGVVVQALGSQDDAPSSPQTDLRDAPDVAEPTGIETAPPQAPSDAPFEDTLEFLLLAPQHLRLVQVTLFDQTDAHDELVLETEWLLHPKENLALQGNLFVVEDTLTGRGLIFLKQAPLPHARTVKSPHDLLVHANKARFHLVGHGRDDADGEGYPFVTLAYGGGRAGCTQTLHTYQRQVRTYEPNRDGMFLSNTWGDRSRDGRVNEPFLTQEVAAAARLGVDVVQIDDGWQQGKTSNSVAAGGVWEGFWNANPDFWKPHPERFPHGLAPLVEQARAHNLQFGLWFAPDSTDDFAHWENDADTLLDLHRTLGVNYFKIDGVKMRTKHGEHNLQRFFHKVLVGSNGRVVFDNDVTAEVRAGYFGLLATGPLFVENRYTDWHGYWPHQTLRNLWKLARYVDPLRLRMEFLNHARNQDKYAGDPLAPSCYTPAYLFATTLFASPLGWFEVSNLPDDYFDQIAPLVRVWKTHREALFDGHLFPIGDAPDGTAWTGFLSVSDDQQSGYVLLFRELNDRAEQVLELPLLSSDDTFTTSVLAGQARLNLSRGRLTAALPQAQSFVFASLTRKG